jgi:PAS domain-containing protein
MHMSERSESVDALSSREPVVDLATDLGRANSELRGSVGRVEAIIQSIGDGVVVADEHGRLQLFNRAAEELLGIGLTNTLPDEWSTTYGLFLADGKTHCPADRLPLTRATCGEEVDGAELLVRNPTHKDLIPSL